MSLPDQFRDALTMVSAAGQRGRLVREIVDIHEDGHIRSWLWRQLLASPTLVGFADESCAVDPGAPLDDSTRGLRLVATPIQREVFLGIYNRNISLSSAQLSLLEAIGSGMDRGVARSDIDEFMGTMQNKEFFRNCKTLIGRNLIVRVNEFTGALRPGTAVASDVDIASAHFLCRKICSTVCDSSLVPEAVLAGASADSR